MFADFATLPSWVAATKRAQLTVSANGRVAGTLTYAGQGTFGPLKRGPITLPAGTTKLTYAATVTDAAGRTVSSTQTVPVTCTAPDPQ